MSNGNIFSEGSILHGSLKISVSLKKTCTKVSSEIASSKNSYDIETIKLIGLRINWTISIWHDMTERSFYQIDFNYSHRN